MYLAVTCVPAFLFLWLQNAAVSLRFVLFAVTCVPAFFFLGQIALYPHPSRVFFGVCLSSKLNTRVGSKSTNFGPARMDREVLIFAHAHNCGTDVARGICVRDVFGCRSWVEMEVGLLWTNIDGPVPGGNLMLPPARPADSPYSKVSSYVLQSQARLARLDSWWR